MSKRSTNIHPSSSDIQNPTRIINFERHGNEDEGHLNVASIQKDVPFLIKRVFWVHDTPIELTRGRHAHIKTEMILIALQGKIGIETEWKGITQDFHLEDSRQGLYIPPLCWHEMSYSSDAIQLVLTSTIYDPEDYIRDYKTFKNIKP